MSRLRKLMLSLLVLGTFTGLALGFRSFLLTNILEPIATLLWALWRMAASVDQNVYWVTLIAACLIFIIRLFPYRSEGTLVASYTYKYSRPAPVEQWRKLIGDAALGKDESDRLRDRLRLLTASVNALDEHADPNSPVENALREKTRLSPEASRFLFPTAARDQDSMRGRRPGFASLLPGWIRMRAGKFIRYDTTLIEEILEKMETEMELEHD